MTSLSLSPSSGILIVARHLKLQPSKSLNVSRQFPRCPQSTLSHHNLRTHIERGKTEVGAESAGTIIDIDKPLLHRQERGGSITRKTRGVGVGHMIKRGSIMMTSSIIRRGDHKSFN